VSVHLPPAPPEAAGAFRDHLPSFLTAPVGLSGVVPVYAAGAQDVINERVLDDARLAAWLTILSSEGEVVAAAEVGGDLQFSRMYEGSFVAGLAEAVRQAEERFADDNRDYELRLLRIPAVYAVALWLHAGDADVLLPVAPAPRALRANALYGADELTAALRPIAQAAMREPDVT
jgi:hypothetical protein